MNGAGREASERTSLMNYSFDAKACNKTSSYLAGRDRRRKRKNNLYEDNKYEKLTISAR
jgi:hypothetical protein